MSHNNEPPLLKTQVKPARAKSKKHKVIVTAKQKRTAQLVLENISTGKPMSKILKQAGYSEGMTKQPSTITESKGFRLALIQAGATEDKLAQVFNSGLEANRVDSIKGQSVA